MSVLIETSIGTIVLDLFPEALPNSANRFIKLCKLGAYDNALFLSVDRLFLAQAADPSSAAPPRLPAVDGKVVPAPRSHRLRGAVGFVNGTSPAFYLTLRDGLESLDERLAAFGEVAEGLEVLEALAEVPVTDDGTCRPLRNVRIKAAEVLEDPFPELEQAEEAAEFVARQRKLEEEKRKKEAFLEEEENVQVKEEMEELKRKEARSRATVLEMVGDLPDADMAPPENVLFVCKLNPVTKAEDLEIIFGRFGEIKSCEVVRDWKTGDSLQYAFIEFQTPQQCEQAYSKMDNVLIDDRRIHVDFSQSVAKMWTDWRRGSIKRKIPEKNPHTTQRTNTFEFTGSSVSRAQKFRQRSPPQRSRRHFSPDRERRTRKRSRERSPSPTYSHRRSDADRSRERYWPSRKTEARDDYRGRRFRSRS